MKFLIYLQLGSNTKRVGEIFARDWLGLVVRVCEPKKSIWVGWPYQLRQMAYQFKN